MKTNPHTVADKKSTSENLCKSESWLQLKVGTGREGIRVDEGTIKTPMPKCRLYWCFCLGWCSNFVGSESGQKQSVKLLHNMVYNTTQHPPTPHPTVSHTLSVYTVRLLWEGGRGGGGQREGRGATVHKRGWKYQHDWQYLQSINSSKHQ